MYVIQCYIGEKTERLSYILNILVGARITSLRVCPHDKTLDSTDNLGDP